ncbi:MAG TPA: sigma-70 family RNA polymerase sigma factor [Thermomicrobiales bacterium]|nr:sigma-70 family RNA polymerase sigma factor [Thermomicrobiales bacterium]
MSEDGQTQTAAAGCLPGEPADDALVLAARHDRQAFSPLYERYATRVYRYARARTGSETAAEDILSETMLGALEALDRYNPRRGSFASWLFTIATRRIIDRQRRDSRFRTLLERAWEPAGTQEDTLTTLVRSDEAARLRAKLAQLPDRDRELILLRYSAELTSAEIGQVAGMSAGAVRIRLMRLLDQLANDLGDVR